MIVDVHGDVSAPERLYAYKANLLPHRDGRRLDDARLLVEAIDRLSDDDRRAIFEDNARSLFSRLGTATSQTAGGS